MTGMNKIILKISFILLVAVSALSCSLDIISEDADAAAEANNLLISGTISDIADSKPLEGIKITFTAYPEEDITSSPPQLINVYSDSKGIYSIRTGGFTRTIVCNLYAEDPSGEYTPSQTSLTVRWTGVSYDKESHAFYVNDCNLQLSKNE